MMDLDMDFTEHAALFLAIVLFFAILGVVLYKRCGRRLCGVENVEEQIEETQTRPKPVVHPNPVTVYTVSTHGQSSTSTNNPTLHTHPVRSTDNNDSILEIIGERNDRRNREQASNQRNDSRTAPTPIVLSTDMPPSYDEAVRSPLPAQNSAI